MKFKLFSKFKPTGDQPEAIKKLSLGIKKGLKNQVLLGVTGSGKTYTMASVIEKVQRPTLVISHNKTLAAQLASELQSFFPKNAVCYFVSYYDYYQPEAYLPSTDTYIAKDAQINEEIDRLRHFATSSLLRRQDVIIVASVSCIYGLGSPEGYKKVKVCLKKGQLRKRDLILAQLINIQYKRNDFDFKRGTFRVRGDILEIFPAYSFNEILKCEFFVDRIEKISKIDFFSGKTKQELNEVDIFPATHYIAPQEKMDLVLNQIREELAIRVSQLKKQKKVFEAERLKQRTEYDLEMIEEIGTCKGIENYSRYFDGRRPGEPPFTLIDYFPKDFLLFIDESHITIPQIRAMYEGDKSRKDALVEYGFRLPSSYDNRPLTLKEFEKKINQTIYVSATPGPYELKKSARVVEQLIRPTGLLDPSIEVKPCENQIDDLIDKIRQRVKKHQRVLVTTLTKRLAEELCQYLQEMDIKVQYLHSEIETLERLEILRDLRLGLYDVVVGINLLREGLDLPEVSLVAILDADKEGYLRSTTALIQTMGRAARHIDGHIVMYADKMTKSMKQAISEVQRRRKIQAAYNKKHGIKPCSIIKEIRKERLAGAKKKEWTSKMEKSLRDLPYLIGENKAKYEPSKAKEIIKTLENQMEIAAQNLEFEKAAFLRDQIKRLKTN